MSKEIEGYATQVRGGEFPSDHARFEWLQDRLSAVAHSWTHPVDPMRAMLARYASAPCAATPGRPMFEGWIEAAGEIASALPDPADHLFGLLIAGEVWELGLRYTLPEMTRFLRRLSSVPSLIRATDDPVQDAHLAYEQLLLRLMDVSAMLAGDLDDNEFVEREWSENPDTLADAIDLLCAAVDPFSSLMESGAHPVVDDEAEKLVSWSGHFLWAAHHARKAGIAYKELAEFVGSFTDVWAKILRALIRDGTLAPGVLEAFSGVPFDEDRIVADGPEIVEAYRTFDPTPDCTLADYLVIGLTATTLDA